MNIFKSFCFSLAKKKSRSRPKKIGSGSSQKTSAPTGSATLEVMMLVVVDVTGPVGVILLLFLAALVMWTRPRKAAFHQLKSTRNTNVMVTNRSLSCWLGHHTYSCTANRWWDWLQLSDEWMTNGGVIEHHSFRSFQLLRHNQVMYMYTGNLLVKIIFLFRLKINVFYFFFNSNCTSLIIWLVHSAKYYFSYVS